MVDIPLLIRDLVLFLLVALAIHALLLFKASTRERRAMQGKSHTFLSYVPLDVKSTFPG